MPYYLKQQKPHKTLRRLGPIKQVISVFSAKVKQKYCSMRFIKIDVLNHDSQKNKPH